LILRLPVAVADIVTEQLPDDNVQVFDENVTLPEPETFDQVTVPVGKYPPTMALQLTWLLTLSVGEEQAIVTVVDPFPTSSP
jgi:hypothetical protein